MWADTDFDEPLNYEKRAPFPTINLLRAAKIREFTSEVPSLSFFDFLHSFDFSLSCMSPFYDIFTSSPPLILQPLVSICLLLSTFCITLLCLSYLRFLDSFNTHLSALHFILVYTAFDDTSVM